jgi:uncharacterized alpha-E superfamily protein
MSEISMLSRVADSLYWTSRYLERAEHIARMLDVQINLMLELTSNADQRMTNLKHSLSLTADGLPDLGNDDMLAWLTFQHLNGAVTQARENARQVREQISSEMWTQINRLYLYARSTQSREIWKESPHIFYQEIREGSHLFQGITDSTMNHNQGWYFIQLGRYVERCFGLLQLLDVYFSNIDLKKTTVITPDDYFELLSVLKSVTAFEAYCKVHTPKLQPAKIVEFLLFDKEFPRSLRFCIEMMQTSLNALAEMSHRNRNTQLYRLAGRLQSAMSYDDMTDIHNLHDYLENIKHQIYEIHAKVYDTYITYPIESAL